MASRLTFNGRLSAAGALVAVLVFVVLGQVVGEYDVSLLTVAFIYGISAVSLDLVWGYVGAPDLGHGLWFGIGALTVGAMTTTTDSTGLVISVQDEPWRYAVSLLLGIAIAAAVAGVVGRFAFSAKGSPFYIAVVTLALTTAATTLYSQFPTVTGGENGLFGFNPLTITTRAWYYLTLAALVLVTAGALILVRSDVGLLLRAVRDNEVRTRYLGYSVENVKTVTFMGGAGLAAFAGGLMALATGLVAADLFTFLFATQMMVWVAVGGRATIIGPVIGAIGLQLLGARLSGSFPTQWSLIQGLLFVLVVVFTPSGILPPLTRAFGRLLRRDARADEREIVPETTAPPPLPDKSPVISVSGLEFGYGSLQVLRGVDLKVQRGELLCVVGPNGAGKSTLVSVLADGNLSARGTVHYDLGAHTVDRRPPAHRLARRGVSRKFQSPQLFESLSAAETVLLARKAGRLPSFWRRSRRIPTSPAVLDVLEAMGLQGRDHEKSTSLAHGLKQGLEIAASVASRPQVLLLDEPTAGLTHNERAVVGTVLQRLARGGMTIILIEHDLDFVNRIADRVVVLHEGRIIEDGTPAEVSNSDVVREAYLGTVA
ncbi:ATP-binding cassette domain-containing protein [Streptomyces sp. NPDC056121]|uniref:branched-chain amino acid ABC transporter ATP-binding protein/permease n=1 Tax=unclassified Streptomyces TaxID=2593676 RepID=UPI00225C2A05|nr:ATP-binding cassette domain-containing protein [Streptomyces sp. NBC_00401]MCX5085396.1 ATP-binding cassette domain-containing protein [Streptomyces sp. NBC_00401]